MKSFPKMLSFRAVATGYYPTPSATGSKENIMEGGPLDCRGHVLHTLQDFLAGHVPYVSVAMDKEVLKNRLPYGTLLHIPALTRYYGKQIEFRVVDTGGHFDEMGLTAIDICTANREASENGMVNRALDVVALVIDAECRECIKKAK